MGTTLFTHYIGVWLCNGLWHGARWSYIFYGMYYFVILMSGIALEPVRDRIIKTFHINQEAGWFRILQTLKTWVIIFTGEMFFRAESLTDGMNMFKSIFRGVGMGQILNGRLLSCGIDVADYSVVIAGCIVVMIVIMAAMTDSVQELVIANDNFVQDRNKSIYRILRESENKSNCHGSACSI